MNASHPVFFAVVSLSCSCGRRGDPMQTISVVSRKRTETVSPLFEGMMGNRVSLPPKWISAQFHLRNSNAWGQMAPSARF